MLQCMLIVAASRTTSGAKSQVLAQGYRTWEEMNRNEDAFNQGGNFSHFALYIGAIPPMLALASSQRKCSNQPGEPSKAYACIHHSGIRSLRWLRRRSSGKHALARGRAGRHHNGALQSARHRHGVRRREHRNAHITGCSSEGRGGCGWAGVICARGQSHCDVVPSQCGGGGGGGGGAGVLAIGDAALGRVLVGAVGVDEQHAVAGARGGEGCGYIPGVGACVCGAVDYCQDGKDVVRRSLKEDQGYVV